MTLLTGSLLCVGALGLAADQPRVTPDSETGKAAGSERLASPRDLADKPARPEATKGKGNERRIQLKPVGDGVKEVVEPPRLQTLVVDRRAGINFDPVTGTGMLMSPQGVPVFVTVRPEKESLLWTGSAMGDEYSIVHVLSTKHGDVASVSSSVWGSWTALPNSRGQLVLRSAPENMPRNWCGTNDFVAEFGGLDLENDPLTQGALAGIDLNCWGDTDDQTIDGQPYWLDEDFTVLKEPGSNANYVGREGSNCLAPVDVVPDSPDTPDWTIQDDDCDGFPTTDHVVDILFGYSVDALEFYGNDVVQIESLAILEIARMNLVFTNSLMKMKARLVGVELGLEYDNSTPYETKGSLPADLAVLYRNIQPQWRGLENLFNDLRDERGADLVTLLVADVPPDGALGIAANIPSGSSIGSRDVHTAGMVYSTLAASDPSYFTFQHEIGHLLGGGHGGPNSAIDSNPDEGTDCPDPPAEADCEVAPREFIGFENEGHFSVDEYAYGYRFPEVLQEGGGTTGRIFQSVMAYAADVGADEEPSIRVPHFSNPDVNVLGTTSATGVFVPQAGDDCPCVCCDDGAENAANAWVISHYASGLVGNDPGLPPLNHDFPGTPQYRCNTIPYDCNQNGILDTEEIDQGLLPDIDGDRIPDGCLGDSCYSFAQNTQLLEGDRLEIIDFTTTESPIEIPYDDDGNNAWALQPTTIVLNNLRHSRLSDLEINLVHRQFGQDDRVWTLVKCDSLPGGSAQIFLGQYTFNAPGDPVSEATYNYLERPTVCDVAAAGGLGGTYVTPGTYRPQEDITSGFDRRPLGGVWLLQITDFGIGYEGSVSSWNLQFKKVPYTDDCDGDGRPDACESEFSLQQDCNQNGAPDACEIASQVSELEPRALDCDLNGILDECEYTDYWQDCGGPYPWDFDGDGDKDLDDIDGLVAAFGPYPGFGPNHRPDLCDLLADPFLDDGTTPRDLNGNFILDTCEVPGNCGSGAPGSGQVGCSDTDCTIAVSLYSGPIDRWEIDTDGDGEPDIGDGEFDIDDVTGELIIVTTDYCATTIWDADCVAIANMICDPDCGGLSCGQVVCAYLGPIDRDGDGVDDTEADGTTPVIVDTSYCCVTGWDSDCQNIANRICCLPGDFTAPGSCSQPPRLGCTDSSCEAQVCALDPTCCDTVWDENCASLAQVLCSGNIPCTYRTYDSLLKGTTGPGVAFPSIGSATSTITVETELEGSGAEDYEEVLDGAIIYGSVRVRIHGLVHNQLNEIDISLKHVDAGGTTLDIPLLAYGCTDAVGYFGGNEIVFQDYGPAKTICRYAAENAGSIGEDGQTEFRADGPLGAFLGLEAAGSWQLILTDVGGKGSGSITGWDISFIHLPPDENLDGVPDVCEIGP